MRGRPGGGPKRRLFPFRGAILEVSMSVLWFSLLLALGAVGQTGPDPKGQNHGGCPPRPASRLKARKLAGRWYKKGIKLYKQKAFRLAHDAFVCTESILPAGLTRYWIARSAQDSGLLEEALGLFEQLAKRPPAPVTRKEILGRIAVLKDRLAARKLAIQKQRGSVTRQGRAGQGKAGEQQHGVAGGALGGRPRRRFEAVSWALWGAGAGLLLTAVALGTVAGVDQRAMENAKDGTWWSPGLDRRYARRNGLLAGTYTLLGAGLLAAAAGTALYFLGRRGKSVAISLDVSRRGAGLRLSLDW